MKLFGKSKSQKSIADFKAGASHISDSDATNAITGGTMDGCHKVGGLKSISTVSTISLSTVSLGASLNLGSIGGLARL